MRIRNVGWLLVGSFVVYLGVACAASKPDGSAGRHDAGALDALTDAVVDILGVDVDDAVRDASAGPTDSGATIDAASCDKKYGPSGSLWYAEKAYAGRSKEDLSRARVLVCEGTPSFEPIPGYSCRTSSDFSVRDGAVAVQCGDKSHFASVTIVMPPPL